MKNKGKYMAQSQGMFGLNIGFGPTIKAALKKADVDVKRDGFGLFTVKNDEIVRIKANGQLY